MEGGFYGRNGYIIDQPGNRLNSRPPQSQARGKAFEDLGTTKFVTKADKLSKQKNRNAGSSQTRQASTSTKNSRVIVDFSDDEMDLLSQASDGADVIMPGDTPKKKKKKREEGGEVVELPPSHTSTSNVLKNLKFKKNKSIDSGVGNGQSGASGSGVGLSNESSVSKPKSTAGSAATHNPFDWDPHSALAPIESSKVPSPPRPTKPYEYRTEPTNMHVPAKSTNPKLIQTQTTLPIFDSRSKPQRGALTSSQAVPGPSRGLGATKVKKAKSAPTKKPIPGSKSSRASSPPQSMSSDSEIELSAIKKNRLKPKPQDFPLPLSRTPSPQPKKRVPMEFPEFSPQSFPSSYTQGFPQLSPLHSPSSNTKLAKSSSNTSLQAKQSAVGGGKAKIKPRPLTKGKQKAAAGLFTDDDDAAADSDAGSPDARIQPFPMSTQMLEDISASPIAGPSRSGKRNSTGENSDDEWPRRKKRKEDDTVLAPLDNYDFQEEDGIILTPGTDPRTLCPYCDTPLPTSPSPLLKRLLTATAKKSYRDSRPGNPLGRKAPLANFIAVCQRHRFESQILPEAEAKGWPKSIEWTKLGGRVEHMKRELQALIDDPGDDLEFDEEGNVMESDEDRAKWGNRANSVFWREVMKDVKKKGSRAVAGVRGQFTNFEKTQPGYYGELGSIIIHQTLYNLFPPASLDSHLLSPLAANEFVQRILVPEVALRLIMEDQRLKSDRDIDKAIIILRESSAYGVAMFPEDDDERAAAGGGRKKRGDDDDDEMGVGDMIVMERARKRRKELEEEEQLEEQLEEENRKLVEEENKTKKAALKEKKLKKGKGKEKEVPTDVEESDVSVVTAVPKIKPKPRPLNKTSTKESIDMSDADATSGVLHITPIIDIRRSRSRQQSPSLSETTHPSAPATSTRSTAGRSSSRSSVVDIDLCLSSSGSEATDDIPINVGGKSRRKRAPPQVEAVVEEDDHKNEDRSPIFNSRTPVTPWKRKHIPNDAIDDEDTPKPVRSLASSNLAVGGPSLQPLMIARQRRAAEKATAKQSVGQPVSEVAQPDVRTPCLFNMRARSSDDSFGDVTVVKLEGNEHSWLLSDSSQSSVESFYR